MLERGFCVPVDNTTASLQACYRIFPEFGRNRGWVDGVNEKSVLYFKLSTHSDNISIIATFLLSAFIFEVLKTKDESMHRLSRYYPNDIQNGQFTYAHSCEDSPLLRDLIDWIMNGSSREVIDFLSYHREKYPSDYETMYRRLHGSFAS